jgi:deferrochelatase/peroxidase EfeB
MRFETWDRTSLREQEAVVGRTKREGAPLSGGKESTEPDFALKGSDGPLVPADSHVALAHPSRNGGVRMLRRGFNYTDGSDGLGRSGRRAVLHRLRDGSADPFVPMQAAMAKNDALAEYLRHTASGLFAIPPGVEPGGMAGAGALRRCLSRNNAMPRAGGDRPGC